MYIMRRRVHMSWISPVLALLFAVTAHAQPYLNLDFETATRGQPWGWSSGAAGYEFAIDIRLAARKGIGCNGLYLTARLPPRVSVVVRPEDPLQHPQLRLQIHAMAEG